MSKSHSLKQRSILLEEALLFSEKVKTYLIYEQTETKRLIDSLSRMEELSQLTFLKSCVEKLQEGIPFPKAWEKSIKEDREMDILTPNDRKNLLLFATVIGKSDVSTQLGGIDLIETLLRQSLAEADRIYAEKGKLYRSLGMLSGMGIAVLLL